MAKKKEKEKPALERTYTIPLRKEWLKAARYKRAKKAITAIKVFLARHMKVAERDVNKIKIDPWLNRAVWLRGIKKPPHKITVKAIKDAEGNVKVEFLGLPPKFSVQETTLKKKISKAEAKIKEKVKEKVKKKEEEKEKKPEKEKTEEEKKEEKEKKEQEERKEKEKILHKEIAKPKKDIIMKKGAGKREKQEQFRKALEK